MSDTSTQLTGPDPRTTPPEELLEYLKSLPDAEAARWVRDNFESIPAGYAADIQGRLLLRDSGTRLYQAFEDGAMDRPGGLNDQQREREITAAVDQAVAAGADPKEAREQVERAFDENILVPDAVIQLYGNRPLSTSQKNDLIQAWNELNPDTPVRTWSDLAQAMNEVPGDPFNQEVVSYAVTGLAPQKAFEITVTTPEFDPRPGMQQRSGTQTVRVDERQLATLQQIYGSGFNERDVKVLAQLAARIGLRDALNEGNGWMVLAAGAAALGMWNFGDRDTREREANTLDPATERAIGVAGTVMGNIARNGTAVTRREQDRLRRWGIQFKTGMSQYGGNETLAFLHAMNPTLAIRVSTTPFEKLPLADRKAAMSHMMRAGFGPDELGKLGYGWAAGLGDADVNMPDDAGGGGRTVVRQLPDPDAVRQSVRDMYMQLFAAEPTDAQLQQLVGSVTGALTSADIDGEDGTVQDVNAQAQIRRRLEELPEYDDLYGKKPAGMTEAEYQQQFRQGAASILGNAAARPDVIRAGMRSGNYNTSVGAAAMTREAWEGSAFLGRLAQAAQLVSENT